MSQYILRRLGYSLISLFLLSLTIFLFVRPHKVVSPARPQVAVAAAPGGGMLSVRGAF